MTKPTYLEPVVEHSWDEFRESGLMWWVNTLLHTFGWALTVDIEDGKVIRAYPSRVVFRGFSETTNDAGYRKVSKYMAKHAKDLVKESES